MQLLCSEYREPGRREEKHGCPRRHIKDVLWGQLIEHHSQAKSFNVSCKQTAGEQAQAASPNGYLAEMLIEEACRQ